MHNEPLDDILPSMEDADVVTPLPAELKRWMAQGNLQVIDTPEEIVLTNDENALVLATPRHVSTVRWLPYSDVRTFRIQACASSRAGSLPNRFLILTEVYGEKTSPLACLDSKENAEVVIKMIHAAIEGHVASKNARHDALPTIESSPKKPSPFVRLLATAGMIVLGIGVIVLLAFLIPYMHHLASRY